MIRCVIVHSGHWKLPITTLFVSATLNVWQIIMVKKRLLSDVFRQLSYRWIKAIILLQYFCTLLCVNSRFCTNVSSTKDYNQLDIYGNGIASCTTERFPHDILNLLYFQTFDEAPDIAANFDQHWHERNWREVTKTCFVLVVGFMIILLNVLVYDLWFVGFLSVFSFVCYSVCLHSSSQPLFPLVILVFQPFTHTCSASVHQLTCFHSVITSLFSSRDHFQFQLNSLLFCLCLLDPCCWHIYALQQDSSSCFKLLQDKQSQKCLACFCHLSAGLL